MQQNENRKPKKVSIDRKVGAYKFPANLTVYDVWKRERFSDRTELENWKSLLISSAPPDFDPKFIKS